MPADMLTEETLKNVQAAATKQYGKPLEEQELKKLLAEIVNAAQQGIADRMFSKDDINTSTKLLNALANDVKEGCKVIVGPPKEKLRAAQKVNNDYGGDWHHLKDVVRMTLVPSEQGKLSVVAEKIVKVCIPANKRGLIKKFELTPDKSPCGYSGWNFVALLENGRAGEIQLNESQMIYGQMAPDKFKAMLGEPEAAKIQKAYFIEGGLGHILYELYREKTKAPVALEAAPLSKEYFALLRGKPTGKAPIELANKIAAFKKKFEKEISELKH